ncbi:NUDIX domain-containing protein [Rhodococcus qingshengii]|nr:NUDIX domain-containing protein [Rhodococcus qingshengii]
MKSIYVDWDGQNVKLTWIPNMEITDSIIITSVHSVCLKEEKVLLAYIKDRGFNYPGGHIEFGENAKEAIHREAFEEGYVKGKIQYIGALEISHEDNSNFDPMGKYPLIAYQAFYRMDVTECCPFLREHESLARIWVEPSEVPYVMVDHELSIVILNEALTIKTN